MLHQIQDEILKRVLDFFGLRGVVSHDYESTVLPVVSIGDLGQKTVSLQSGNTLPTVFTTVPVGKVWRPLMLAGRITQTGGVTAITLSVQVTGLSGPGFNIPFYTAPSGGPDTSGLQIRRTFALNTVNDILAVFPEGLLIPAGGTVLVGAIAGDGTISMSANSSLMVQELGEGLVSLQ